MKLSEVFSKKKQAASEIFTLPPRSNDTGEPGSVARLVQNQRLPDGTLVNGPGACNCLDKMIEEGEKDPALLAIKDKVDRGEEITDEDNQTFHQFAIGSMMSHLPVHEPDEAKRAEHADAIAGRRLTEPAADELAQHFAMHFGGAGLTQRALPVGFKPGTGFVRSRRLVNLVTRNVTAPQEASQARCGVCKQQSDLLKNALSEASSRTSYVPRKIAEGQIVGNVLDRIKNGAEPTSSDSPLISRVYHILKSWKDHTSSAHGRDIDLGSSRYTATTRMNESHVGPVKSIFDKIMGRTQGFTRVKNQPESMFEDEFGQSIFTHPEEGYDEKGNPVTRRVPYLRMPQSREERQLMTGKEEATAIQQFIKENLDKVPVRRTWTRCAECGGTHAPDENHTTSTRNQSERVNFLPIRSVETFSLPGMELTVTNREHGNPYYVSHFKATMSKPLVLNGQPVLDANDRPVMKPIEKMVEVPTRYYRQRVMEFTDVPDTSTLSDERVLSYPETVGANNPEPEIIHSDLKPSSNPIMLNIPRQHRYLFQKAGIRPVLSRIREYFDRASDPRSSVAAVTPGAAHIQDPSNPDACHAVGSVWKNKDTGDVIRNVGDKTKRNYIEGAIPLPQEVMKAPSAVNGYTELDDDWDIEGLVPDIKDMPRINPVIKTNSNQKIIRNKDGKQTLVTIDQYRPQDDARYDEEGKWYVPNASALEGYEHTTAPLTSDEIKGGKKVEGYEKADGSLCTDHDYHYVDNDSDGNPVVVGVNNVRGPAQPATYISERKILPGESTSCHSEATGTTDRLVHSRTGTILAKAPVYAHGPDGEKLFEAGTIDTNGKITYNKYHGVRRYRYQDVSEHGEAPRYDFADARPEPGMEPTGYEYPHPGAEESAPISPNPQPFKGWFGSAIEYGHPIDVDAMQKQGITFRPSEGVEVRPITTYKAVDGSGKECTEHLTHGFDDQGNITSVREEKPVMTTEELADLKDKAEDDYRDAFDLALGKVYPGVSREEALSTLNEEHEAIKSGLRKETDKSQQAKNRVINASKKDNNMEQWEERYGFEKHAIDMHTVTHGIGTAVNAVGHALNWLNDAMEHPFRKVVHWNPHDLARYNEDVNDAHISTSPWDFQQEANFLRNKNTVLADPAKAIVGPIADAMIPVGIGRAVKKINDMRNNIKKEKAQKEQLECAKIYSTGFILIES